MPRAARTLTLAAELTALLQSGASVLVGTRDAALVPELIRAWGPRFSRDRKWVSVCVAAAGSKKTLHNLKHNGRLAVTFALPANARAIQLWGRVATVAQAHGQDLAAVREHRDAFARVNEGIVPRGFIESMWRRELATSPAMVRIRFVAEQLFDQTPGPSAGSPL